MKVKIIAYVQPEDEAEFSQALEDGDFSWMKEIDPKWIEVEECDE